MEISFNAFIFLDFSRLPCIRRRIELITKKGFLPLKIMQIIHSFINYNKNSILQIFTKLFRKKRLEEFMKKTHLIT